jgi:hypothetical protein
MPVLAPGQSQTSGQTSVDTGYFTGSFTYTPTFGTNGQPLEVNIGTGADFDGIAWLWTGIQGWDSPGTSGQIVQRAADHGGWATSQYYAPRVMTITVEANAPNEYLRDLARARLQQIIPVNDLCTMVYNEPIPKLVQLRRSGQITEAYPNTIDVQFSIVCTAPDPRKYNAIQKLSPTGTLATETFTYIGTNAPVIGGFQVYSTSAWSSGLQAVVYWYTSSGSFISSSSGTLSALPSSTWTAYTVSVTPANIPSNAVNAAVLVQISGTPPGSQLFYVDGPSSLSGILSQAGNALNANSNFTSGVAPWTGGDGASVAQSSAHVAPGYSYSMAITPNGTTANPYAISEQEAFGQSYNAIGQAAGSNNVFLPGSITPGTTIANNLGTFETRPVITITGPANGPAMRNRLTGQIVSYSQIVMGAHDVLVVDFDQRFGTLNGSFRPADIQSSWWTIWPGENVIELLGGNVSAGASMSVSYADAWI